MTNQEYTRIVIRYKIYYKSIWHPGISIFLWLKKVITEIKFMKRRSIIHDTKCCFSLVTILSKIFQHQKKSLKTYQLRQALPHLLPLILYSGYFLCYNETGQNKKVKNTEMTKKPQYHRKLQKHITNNTKI